MGLATLEQDSEYHKLSPEDKAFVAEGVAKQDKEFLALNEQDKIATLNYMVSVKPKTQVETNPTSQIKTPEAKTLAQDAKDAWAQITGTTRGALNLGEDVYKNLVGRSSGGQSVPAKIPSTQTQIGLGDRLLLPEGSPSSSFGIPSLFDPAAYAIGAGGAKILPYSQVLGKGFLSGTTALAKNMLSNSAIGGTIGGLNDGIEGAQSGAILGASSGVLTPLVVGGGTKALGYLTDLSKGNVVNSRSGKLLRDIIGKENLGKARIYLNTADDKLTAAQALEPLGLTKVSALGDRASAIDSQYYENLNTMLTNQARNQVANIAGGATQTAAKTARGNAKNILYSQTDKLREANLDRANYGKSIYRTQDSVDQLNAEAADSVQKVRDMELLKVIANEKGLTGDMTLAVNSGSAHGAPRLPQQYSYAKQLEGKAENVATQAAQNSLIAGEKSRAKQALLGFTARHGVAPLNTDKIINNIESLKNNPNLAGNEVAQDVLNTVSRDIINWTEKNGGVIDSKALYSIRKNAITQKVGKLLSGQEPELAKKQASELLAKVNPMIDDAIVNAGGRGWRKYLKTYSDGMDIINRQKLGAKALEAFDASPEAFVKLAQGNNPKVVQDIFGDKFDINIALGSDNPTVQKIAKDMVRNKNLERLSGLGSDELNAILLEDASSKTHFVPSLISAKVAAAKKGAQLSEQLLNKKTMARAYQAMRNGKDASALMDTLSTYEKSAVLQSIANGKFNPYITSQSATSIQENQ